MKNEIKPGYIRNNLVGMGYSENSADIIEAQYRQFPGNRNRWGTEEQTRLDMEAILSKWFREITGGQ